MVPLTWLPFLLEELRMVYRRDVAVQGNYTKSFERSKAALKEDSFPIRAFLRRSENMGY